nr:hypothetical protein [Tanacetum cinerariifolium]
MRTSLKDILYSRNSLGLDEFTNKPVVENCDAKTSETKPKDIRKNTDALIIEEWMSNDEEEEGNPQIDLHDKGVIDSRCSRHMTGNMFYLTDYEEIDRGYVAFKITGKGTTLNTLDHLGKFNGKADEGFFVGYSINSKAFRVFNSRKRIAEENLHIRFSENTPNVVGTKAYDNAGQARKEKEPVDEDSSKGSVYKEQEQEDNVNRTNNVNAASTNRVNVVSKNISSKLPFDPDMPALEDISTFNLSSDHEDDDEEADMYNMDTTIQVSHIPTTRIHKDHPLDQVIGDLHSTTQTRNMSNNLEEHGFVTTIHQITNHKDLQNYLFACFYHKKNPKRDIGTKWVFKNKKDESGIIIRNKARLVAQRHTQEEGIDYDEVFALVTRIKAIRLFLAYASFKDFVVYQINVKSDFLNGKIEEEGKDFIIVNPFFLCVELCIAFEKMMHEKFQMSYMGELIFFLGLQVKQKQDGIFISKDKYVAEILKKYGFSEVKNASTPMETQKPLLKYEDCKEVDVHMYILMIGSLMCLTSLRPDIMFIVCACAKYQVNLKVSHLHVVKMIFRLIYDELSYNHDELRDQHQRLFVSLKKEQKQSYATVMEAVDKENGGMFFVYGYGGTGKTYLHKTMSATLRSKEEIV